MISISYIYNKQNQTPPLLPLDTSMGPSSCINNGTLLFGCAIFTIINLIINMMSFDSFTVADKVNNLIEQSTEMYWQNNYPACIAILNDCIMMQPHISALFSNRAIAYYHLKEPHTSLEDLEKAIRINHQNFIAYFNIFSIRFLRKDNHQSFQNLCLCLSSAYTLLGKSQRDLSLMNKSIHYSYNNKESLFLKAMLLLQKNNQLQSLQLLKHCQQYQHQGKNRQVVLSFIDKIEQSLLLPHSQHNSSEKQQENKQKYQLKTDLQCPLDQNQYEGSILLMLKEFNDVYRRIIEANIASGFQFQGQLGQMKSQTDVKDKESCKTRNNTFIQSENTIMNEERQVIPKLNTTSSNLRQLNICSILKHQLFNTAPNFNSKTYQKYQLTLNNIKLKQTNIPQQYSNLYFLMIPYANNSSNFPLMSSMRKTIQGQCSWDSQSYLMEECMKIKVLNKRFTQYKDDLVGECLVQMRAGNYSMQLLSGGMVAGSCELCVQQSE